jgi:hypothetical protein
LFASQLPLEFLKLTFLFFVFLLQGCDQPVSHFAESVKLLHLDVALLQKVIFVSQLESQI